MNFKFNKSIPSILACIAAFIITLIIKSMLPSSRSELAGNDLPLPDIPFQEKDKKKEKDHFVLIALRDIKQYEKVSAQAVTWKKWPKDAISVQFIAKDADGNMLNSNLSYSNVINLYTKYPITKGTPITMNVLSRKRGDKTKKSKISAMENAIRKEVETKIRSELSKDFDKKLADEKATMKKNSLDAARNSVTSGMSVISVPIDQRSITSKEFLKIGDRIDLLFSANKNAGAFIKFRNVKLLEIDGKTDIVEKIQDTAPKSITVEISTNQAEDLLKQVGSGKSAVIIVKNQKDITREELGRNHVYDIITGRGADKRREKFLLDEALKVTSHRANEKRNSLEQFAERAFSSKPNGKKKDNASNNESALQDIAAKWFNAKATEKSTADSLNSKKLLNLALRGFSTNTQNKPSPKTSPDSKSSATNGIIQQLFTALGEKEEKPTKKSNVINKIAEDGFKAERSKDERNHDLYKYAQSGFQSGGTEKNAKANDNERIIELNKYIENGFKSEEKQNPQMIYTNIVNKTFKKQSKNNDYRSATEKLKDKGGTITISRKNASQSVQYDGSGRIVVNSKNKQSSAPAIDSTPAIDSFASDSSILGNGDSIDTNIDAAAILNSIKNGGI